jgi:Uma2 family endonuclease
MGASHFGKSLSDYIMGVAVFGAVSMTSAISEQVRWTITDLEGFPDNGNRYEIIDGDLFVTRAPHWDHQDIVGAIYAELRAWSRQSGLGQAAVTPGIIFSEADAVIPDVVWASHERLAQFWIVQVI